MKRLLLAFVFLTLVACTKEPTPTIKPDVKPDISERNINDYIHSCVYIYQNPTEGSDDLIVESAIYYKEDDIKELEYVTDETFFDEEPFKALSEFEASLPNGFYHTIDPCNPHNGSRITSFHTHQYGISPSSYEELESLLKDGIKEKITYKYADSTRKLEAIIDIPYVKLDD